MLARRRTSIRKGSWRWAVNLAELTAWGTAALILLVLSVADVPDFAYRRGLLMVVALGAWLVVFFRVLLARRGPASPIAWLGIVVDLAFAAGFFALLRGYIPSAQLIFVPMIMATGLLANFSQALAATGLAVASYLGVTLAQESGPTIIPT